MKSQKNLYEELKCIEDRENEKIEYEGQKYTLMHMAKWVKDNEDDSFLDSRQDCSLIRKTL